MYMCEWGIHFLSVSITVHICVFELNGRYTIPDSKDNVMSVFITRALQGQHRYAQIYNSSSCGRHTKCELGMAPCKTRCIFFIHVYDKDYTNITMATNLYQNHSWLRIAKSKQISYISIQANVFEYMVGDNVLGYYRDEYRPQRLMADVQYNRIWNNTIMNISFRVLRI